MKKKILPLLTAAALIAVMGSCAGEKEQTAAASDGSAQAGSSEDAAQAASAQQTENSSGTESFNWESIDPGMVVAHVEGADDLDITFGEFYSEYKYYLVTYGIENDADPSFAENCRSYRTNIAAYMQYEKIFLKIAEEEGVGESSLTKEEQEEIQKSADDTRANFLVTYYNTAVDQLGENAAPAQIQELEEKLLSEDLKKAGLPDDIFLKWERNDFIQNKLMSRVTAEAEVTEKQIDDMYEEYLQSAKDAFAENPLSYESSNIYPQIYVPEGTRLADQILFMFDEETRSAISAARSEGNSEEADKLRAEAYESQLKEKAENVIALIESGDDFDELQKTYNEDGGNDPYAVVPGSMMYVSEFTEAIFSVEAEGGVSYPAVSDYGVHIIKYVGDKIITDGEKEKLRGSMKEYLEYQEQMKLQEAAYNDWVSRYKYTVDYKTLGIDDPSAS